MYEILFHQLTNEDLSLSDDYFINIYVWQWTVTHTLIPESKMLNVTTTLKGPSVYYKPL